MRPLDGVPERPSGERRESYRIVALDPLLGPELQANSRIVAGLRDPPVQRKELLGAYEDSLQLEQSSWQTGLPQDGIRRKTQVFELSRQRTRNAKAVAHGLRESITLDSTRFRARLLLVLIIADVLHPIDDLPSLYS